MSDQQYTLIENLSSLLDSIQMDSIISRTFYKDAHMKAILFGFDSGQELSEHTSSQKAIIQLVSGEATITVGEDRYELGAGAWIIMQPHVKHSIHARTPVQMLLMMFGA